VEKMIEHPLIYDFIEKKKNSSEQIKFDYSDKHDLNVVQFNGESIPFVQLARDEKVFSKLYELRTKTFEEREEEEEPDESYMLNY
jgi:hypothetical protein